MAALGEVVSSFPWTLMKTVLSYLGGELRVLFLQDAWVWEHNINIFSVSLSN